jgi:hypothetical protein
MCSQALLGPTAFSWRWFCVAKREDLEEYEGGLWFNPNQYLNIFLINLSICVFGNGMRLSSMEGSEG